MKNGTTSVFSVDNYANLTCNGIGSISIMNGATANFYVDYSGNISNKGTINSTGNISTGGDITYNNGTSLTTTISNCATKTSGTITSTTTFQTFFTPVNQHGFIYVAAGPPGYSTASAFFEALTGSSYSSLTLVSQGGDAAQAVINTSSASTGGTVRVSLQNVGGAIQVKTTSTCTVKWFVMMF